MLNNGEYEAAKIYIDGLAQNAKDDANKEDEEEKDESLVSSHIYGEWIKVYYSEEGTELVKIQFNDDSTCQMGDKSFTWKLYNEYDNQAVFRVYEGKKVVYIVDLSRNDKGDYTLGYSEVTQKDEDSFEYENNGWAYFNPANYDYVEITVDNLMDYFEWTEEDGFDENSFGEAISYYTRKVLKMKQEYADKLFEVSEDLAIELSYNTYKVSAEVDLGNRTCTRGEELEKTSQEKNTNVYTGYWRSETEGYNLSMDNGYYSEYEGALTSIKGDEEVLRAMGQFYFRK